MADIEEIPLDQTENTENNQEIIQDNEEIMENIQEEPAPKKKGRPPGAKNKPKPQAAKPKPKPKAKVKKQPEYEEYESEEEELPPPRRRASQPAEVDRRQLAAEVLGLLQQQRYDQTTARRSHYASWFTNM